MKIFFVRHGESAANIKGHITGPLDTPLTPLGRQQVSALHSSYICQIPFDVVFSSPAKRARDTAGILFPNQPIIVADELLEVDAGEASEWTLAKVNQYCPEFWTRFDPDRSYPGGESYHDLYIRINKWLDQCLVKYNTAVNIAVVAHGGPIGCVLHRVRKIPMAQFPCCPIHNAEVIELLAEDIKKAPAWIDR